MAKLIFNPVRKLLRVFPDKSDQHIMIERNNSLLNHYYASDDEEEKNITRAQDE